MTEQFPKERASDGSLDEIVQRARRRAIRVHGGAALFFWVAASLVLLLLATWGLAAGLGPWVRASVGVAIAAGAVAALLYTYKRAFSLGTAEIAKHLEEKLPEARGLVSALELAPRLLDPTFPYSSDLARAHVEETRARVARLPLSQAFDPRPLTLAWRSAAATGALFLGALALWPAAFGGLVGAAPAVEEVARRASPITGDISITYVYPRYSGLERRTVEGTSGALSALRGTEVRIETRADREVAKAFIEVGGASLPLEVEGGRFLQGTLRIQDPGSYAFRFEDERGKVLARGPEIPIEVVEDQAPTISIDAPTPELVVTEREAVELRYEAADDYGLTQVELVFKVGPTEEERIAVASPSDGRRRQSGTYTWELAPLDLRPGETVTYYLRAKDNDAVSGEKWGQSRTQTLKVYSEAEHRRELLAKAEEAWEQMILGLGARITPREGPRKVEGEERVEAGRQADVQVELAVGLLQDVAAAFLEDEAAPEELYAAVKNLSINLGRKSRHTRATRARSPAVKTGRASYLRQLDQVEADEQDALEGGVLYLESLLDRQRLFEIEELSRELAESRQELTNLLETYQDAPTEEAQRAVMRELSRLRQRIGELMGRMAQLSRGIQDEHLNLEAQKALAQERDLMGQLDEVEKMVADGDLEGALAEMQKLAMQMDQLTESLGDAADSQLENDPALQKLAEDLQAFDEELAALEEKQRALAEETERLREEQSRELQRRLATEGEDPIAALIEKARQARGIFGALPEHRLPRTSSDDLRGTVERLEDLENALHAKDFDAALESAASSLGFAMSLDLGLERERSYAERFGIGSADELHGWREAARRGVPPVREVKEALEEMFSQPSQALGPREQQQLESLAQEQGELGERMEALRQQAEEIGEQAPLFDDGSMQSMEEARQAMQDASGKLRSHQPGQALASERRAQEQLDALRQGLEQAKEQARSNRGGGGFPLPMGGGGRRGGSGSSFDGSEKVEIPDADQFEAPEAYRKEILDAMKKKAPESYEEPVKDYYEEIVK